MRKIFIEKTIESMRNQSVQEIEMIFVDDGSTDNSLAILKQYELIDSRIKVYSIDNNGASYARNYGFSHSSGEFIVYFDSDDIMDEFMIERLTAYDCASDIVMGQTLRINKHGNLLSTKSLEDSLNTYDLTSNEDLVRCMNFMPFPGNKLYRRSLIENYNLEFAPVTIGQDLNFYLKYLCVANTITVIPDVVSYYRIINSSISHVPSIRVTGIIQSFEDILYYAETQTVNESFTEEIINLKLKHYRTQFQKASFISSRKDQRYVYTTMYQAIIESVHGNEIFLNSRSQEIMKYVNFRYFMRGVYFSRLYSYIRSKKWGGFPGV